MSDLFNHLSYVILSEQVDKNERYYESLDKHLHQYNMSLGDNHWDKVGWADPSQIGIYFEDKQIGKIERKILTDNEPQVLELTHISAKIPGHSLVRKIYPHDREYALKHGMDVSSELVNEYTKQQFLLTFHDWKIQQNPTEEDHLIALNPNK